MKDDDDGILKNDNYYYYDVYNSEYYYDTTRSSHHHHHHHHQNHYDDDDNDDDNGNKTSMTPPPPPPPPPRPSPSSSQQKKKKSSSSSSSSRIIMKKLLLFGSSGMIISSPSSTTTSTNTNTSTNTSSSSSSGNKNNNMKQSKQEEGGRRMMAETKKEDKTSVNINIVLNSSKKKEKETQTTATTTTTNTNRKTHHNNIRKSKSTSCLLDLNEDDESSGSSSYDSWMDEIKYPSSASFDDDHRFTINRSSIDASTATTTAITTNTNNGTTSKKKNGVKKFSSSSSSSSLLNKKKKKKKKGQHSQSTTSSNNLQDDLLLLKDKSSKQHGSKVCNKPPSSFKQKRITTKSKTSSSSNLLLLLDYSSMKKKKKESFEEEEEEEEDTIMMRRKQQQKEEEEQQYPIIPDDQQPLPPPFAAFDDSTAESSSSSSSRQQQQPSSYYYALDSSSNNNKKISSSTNNNKKSLTKRRTRRNLLRKVSSSTGNLLLLAEQQEQEQDEQQSTQQKLHHRLVVPSHDDSESSASAKQQQQLQQQKPKLLSDNDNDVSSTTSSPNNKKSKRKNNNILLRRRAWSFGNLIISHHEEKQQQQQDETVMTVMNNNKNNNDDVAAAVCSTSSSSSCNKLANNNMFSKNDEESSSKQQQQQQQELSKSPRKMKKSTVYKNKERRMNLLRKSKSLGNLSAPSDLQEKVIEMADDEERRQEGRIKNSTSRITKGNKDVVLTTNAKSTGNLLVARESSSSELEEEKVQHSPKKKKKKSSKKEGKSKKSTTKSTNKRDDLRRKKAKSTGNLLPMKVVQQQEEFVDDADLLNTTEERKQQLLVESPTKKKKTKTKKKKALTKKKNIVRKANSTGDLLQIHKKESGDDDDGGGGVIEKKHHSSQENVSLLTPPRSSSNTTTALGGDTYYSLEARVLDSLLRVAEVSERSVTRERATAALRRNLLLKKAMMMTSSTTVDDDDQQLPPPQTQQKQEEENKSVVASSSTIQGCHLSSSCSYPYYDNTGKEELLEEKVVDSLLKVAELSSSSDTRGKATALLSTLLQKQSGTHTATTTCRSPTSWETYTDQCGYSDTHDGSTTGTIQQESVTCNGVRSRSSGLQDNNGQHDIVSTYLELVSRVPPQEVKQDVLALQVGEHSQAKKSNSLIIDDIPKYGSSNNDVRVQTRKQHDISHNRAKFGACGSDRTSQGPSNGDDEFAVLAFPTKELENLCHNNLQDRRTASEINLSLDDTSTEQEKAITRGPNHLLVSSETIRSEVDVAVVFEREEGLGNFAESLESAVQTEDDFDLHCRISSQSSHASSDFEIAIADSSGNAPSSDHPRINHDFRRPAYIQPVSQEGAVDDRGTEVFSKPDTNGYASMDSSIGDSSFSVSNGSMEIPPIADVEVMSAEASHRFEADVEMAADEAPREEDVSEKIVLVKKSPEVLRQCPSATSLFSSAGNSDNLLTPENTEATNSLSSLKAATNNEISMTENEPCGGNIDDGKPVVGRADSTQGKSDIDHVNIVPEDPVNGGIEIAAPEEITDFPFDYFEITPEDDEKDIVPEEPVNDGMAFEAPEEISSFVTWPEDDDEDTPEQATKDDIRFDVEPEAIQAQIEQPEVEKQLRSPTHNWEESEKLAGETLESEGMKPKKQQAEAEDITQSKEQRFEETNKSNTDVSAVFADETFNGADSVDDFDSPEDDSTKNFQIEETDVEPQQRSLPIDDIMASKNLELVTLPKKQHEKAEENIQPVEQLSEETNKSNTYVSAAFSSFETSSRSIENDNIDETRIEVSPALGGVEASNDSEIVSETSNEADFVSDCDSPAEGEVSPALGGVEASNDGEVGSETVDDCDSPAEDSTQEVVVSPTKEDKWKKWKQTKRETISNDNDRSDGTRNEVSSSLGVADREAGVAEASNDSEVRSCNSASNDSEVGSCESPPTEDRIATVVEASRNGGEKGEGTAVCNSTPLEDDNSRNIETPPAIVSLATSNVADYDSPAEENRKTKESIEKTASMDTFWMNITNSLLGR